MVWDCHFEQIPVERQQLDDCSCDSEVQEQKAEREMFPPEVPALQEDPVVAFLPGTYQEVKGNYCSESSRLPPKVRSSTGPPGVRKPLALDPWR